MSTQVSIYGLETGGMLQFFPRIADYCHDMGFSNMADTLEYVSRDRPDILEEHIDDPRAGLRQYQVLVVPALIQHVRENHLLWSQYTVGFKCGLELMEKKQDLAWWFHVCS